VVLRDVRARIEQIDDLRDLFEALGFKLVWEAVPPGPGLLLEQLLEDATPLSARNLLAWHEQLPPPSMTAEPPRAELVAALIVTVSRAGKRG
jgi:hypothetical protein